MTSRPAAILSALLILNVFYWPSQTEAADVVLVLDRSLSMNENDPNLVSLKGAELLGELLDPDDRLAVTTFAQDGVTMLPLTPLADRERIQTLIRQIRMDGKRTNFEAALLNAERHFTRAGGNPSEQRAVVLFSDGQLNVGTEDINRASHDTILKEILPRFKAAGIPIHAVAFSPKADLDFLTLMATGTGGQAFRANTPEDIYDAFVRLFEQAQQPLSVPLIDGQVTVDANVQELKLLVKREPGDGPMRLTDPSNRDLTVDASTPGVDWQSTPDFDRITIQNPEAGSWKVMAGNGEKKAYIESNLDLNARLPVMAGVNEAIRIAARLSYQGAPVDASLLKNARFTATVLDDADAIQQQIELKPDAGGQNAQDYRGELRIPASGSFQVRVNAEGLGFQRQKGYFISIVGAQQQAALSDVAQTDAVPGPPQQTALFIVLGGNLALVVLGAIGFAIWRWRRRRQHTDAPEADDLTLD